MGKKKTRGRKRNKQTGRGGGQTASIRGVGVGKSPEEGEDGWKDKME